MDASSQEPCAAIIVWGIVVVVIMIQYFTYKILRRINFIFNIFNFIYHRQLMSFKVF
jgi:hypothetical protein